MVAESFWFLLRDPGHWLFELFLIVVFDLLVGALTWPFVKRWWGRHQGAEEMQHGLTETDIHLHVRNLYDRIEDLEEEVRGDEPTCSNR